MTISVLIEPAAEPVSLAAAKEWARIDSDDASQDATLALLIKGMRAYAENLTARAFVRRKLRLTLPCWPDCIELPYPPLSEVTAITYVDLDGASQTLAADQYVVHSWKEPGFILPAWTVVWPALRAVPNAVLVDFYAGYPAGSPDDATGLTENVPAPLKLWLQARLATLYENREQLVQATQKIMPHPFCDGLLDDLVVGSRLF